MITYDQLKKMVATETKERAITAMIAYGWSNNEAEYAYNSWQPSHSTARTHDCFDGDGNLIESITEEA